MKVDLLIMRGRYRIEGKIYVGGDIASIEQDKKNLWFVDGLVDSGKAKVVNGERLTLSQKELKAMAESEAVARKQRSKDADNAARGVTPEVLAALKESKKA